MVLCLLFETMAKFTLYNHFLASSLHTVTDSNWNVIFLCSYIHNQECHFELPVNTGSPSRSGNVTIYVFDINQLSLPTPFYSVLVSISVFMALTTVFHSINSHASNSPLSYSVLPVLFLSYWSFQLHISLYESLLQSGYNSLWMTELKAPTN